MIWLFASVVLYLAVVNAGFRKWLLIAALAALAGGTLTMCAMGAAGAFR
jgi:hypothetical protein